MLFQLVAHLCGNVQERNTRLVRNNEGVSKISAKFIC